MKSCLLDIHAYVLFPAAHNYKPSVAAMKLFSNAVVNLQLSDPYNTCSTHHRDDLSLLFMFRSL